MAKKIETAADIEGFPDIKDEDKDTIRKLISEFDSSKSPAKAGKTGKTGKVSKTSSKGEGASTATLAFGSPSAKPSGLVFYLHTIQYTPSNCSDGFT